MKLKDYDGQKVRVVDVYGKTHIGFVDSYTQPNDNDGQEAITLTSGVWLDESDIKSIEIVN
jgi:hypothetical protein